MSTVLKNEQNFQIQLIYGLIIGFRFVPVLRFKNFDYQIGNLPAENHIQDITNQERYYIVLNID